MRKYTERDSKIGFSVYILVLTLLSSCTLHDRYQRPEVAMPTQWRLQTDEASTITNVNWWKQLQDPALDEMITQALEYNQDLKVAIYTVEQYIAKLGIARSQLYPQVNATAGALREELSQEVTPLLPGTSRFEDEYQLLLNASYEVDIWGQIRSATEVALANLLSQVETRRTVVLTLVSAVATNYILLRQYDLQLDISRSTLKSRQEEMRLALIRFKEGLTSEMPVKQAAAEVDSAEASVKELEISIALQEDLLSVLLGVPPGPIKRGLTLGEIPMPPDVPAGLPSELLNQRPDILAAEQTLIAANAQIGVAKAAFFPQITLTGLFGGQSTALSDLFKTPARTWQYGATILQEIFTGGELTNQLKLAKAQKLTALHAYESTILTAFKEVNDALISHKINLELVQIQADRVRVVAEYFNLATLRYNEGQNDYLTVLDAERELFRAQLDHAAAQGASFTSFVDLYKSLGGGWVADADHFAKDSPTNK